MDRFPTFCICGAPKAGTTSLAAWLGGHPQIVMTYPKEPGYFAFDAPPGYRQIETLERYEALFRPSEPGQLCGEATSYYLFSPVAIRALLSVHPMCRLIVMVRNPLDLLPALHAQKLRSLEEHEPDFMRAWRLSPVRRLGGFVRRRCRAPQYLDYQRIGCLGEQVLSLMDLAAARRTTMIAPYVIVFDDLAQNPARTYLGVLRFLGLEDDGRDDFAPHNTRAELSRPGLARILQAAPVQRLKRAAQRIAPGPAATAIAAYHKLTERPAPRTELAPDDRAELVDFYRGDVAMLGRLLGRDLNHWLE